MEKYPEQLCEKMREIYKAIMERIRETGKTDKADVLFLHLYKTQFEQNTNYKE